MTATYTKTLDIQFQKRLLPNLITNIINFVLGFSVGLILTPYFVDTLGYAAYGLIPLATSITSYVTIIIDSVNIPVSRYLSISIQKGDQKQANITYNTVLVGTLGIILILIPVAIAIAWLSPTIFNIGSSSTTDVFLLFLLVIGSVLLRAWGSNFMAILFAYNRLDLRNYVNITSTVTQVGLIVLLFVQFTPSLVSVGVAYFIAAGIALILSIIFSKKTAIYLKIKPSTYSNTLFKNIVSVSFWSLIDKLGCILSGAIALIVANRILGEVLASDYSISLTVYTGLVSIGGLITTLFTPKVYSYISSNDLDGLTTFCKSAIKCSGLVITLPVALICLFTPEFITIWLGLEYIYLTPLICMVILPVLILTSVSPIASFGVAFLRVRLPALSALFTGCLNLILATHLPLEYNLSVYGIALASIISLWLHAGVICPIYYAYITKIPWYTYTLQIHKTLLYLIAALIIGGLVIVILKPAYIIMTIIVMGLVCIIYISLIPRITFTTNEKKIVSNCIPKFIPNCLIKLIF